LGSVPYPLGRQQLHQFAGEHEVPAYTSYAASDMDTASSAGPGTPASSDWSPASFNYPTATSFTYGNLIQAQSANNAAAYGHLYGSVSHLATHVVSGRRLKYINADLQSWIRQHT
jgi:hypothetical protein